MSWYCHPKWERYNKKHYIYVLDCQNDNFYTGMTANLIHRLYSHISGIGSKYTSRHYPINLVHLECCNDHPSAINLEIATRRNIKTGWTNFYVPEEFDDLFYRIVAIASEVDISLPIISSLCNSNLCDEFITLPYCREFDDEDLA